jgi:hypothetical protein
MKMLTNVEVAKVSGGSLRQVSPGPPLKIDSVDWDAVEGSGELIPLPPLRFVAMADK